MIYRRQRVGNCRITWSGPSSVRGELEETWFEGLLQYAEDLGASVNYKKLSAGNGGSIAPVKLESSLNDGSPKTTTDEDAGFVVVLNEDLPRSSQFSVLVHELAHLLLGHLGGNKRRKIPDRHCIENDLREIEAESVTHLVCSWLDLQTFSDRYLGLHRTGLDKEISETSVIYAAGKIERVIKTSREKPVNVSKKDARRVNQGVAHEQGLLRD